MYLVNHSKNALTSKENGSKEVKHNHIANHLRFLGKLLKENRDGFIT